MARYRGTHAAPAGRKKQRTNEDASRYVSGENYAAEYDESDDLDEYEDLYSYAQPQSRGEHSRSTAARSTRTGQSYRAESYAEEEPPYSRGVGKAVATVVSVLIAASLLVAGALIVAKSIQGGTDAASSSSALYVTQSAAFFNLLW